MSLSTTGSLSETPATGTGASGPNPNMSGKEGSDIGSGAGRLPSLDISACTHLDELHSESGVGAFDSAQHEQYTPSQYGEYYRYDVNLVVKRSEEGYAGEGAYDEATA